MNINELFKSYLLPDEVIEDADLLVAYNQDWRRRYQSDCRCVLRPSSVAAVQTIMQIANQYHICVTPQGGNTSLCGAAIPGQQNSVIVSMSGLNKVRSFNLLDKSVTVEAGITLQNLQYYIAEQGYYFPLSLASEGLCQIGGNIACNAGGIHVLRYGTMRDLVLGLEVVLPSGELVTRLASLHKDTTGLDSKQIWIGSEGTLGIITAATLKIYPKIVTKITLLIACDGIKAVLNLLEKMQYLYFNELTGFEYMSKDVFELAQQFNRVQLDLPGNNFVLCELSLIRPQADFYPQFLANLIAWGFADVIVAQSEQQVKQLWQLRESISEAQKQLLGVCIKHDIAVPIQQLNGFIHECELAVTAEFPDARIILFGHLGDGSLHYNISLARDNTNTVYQYEAALNQIVYDKVLVFSGTIAAEHGIGQLKKNWLPYVKSATEIKLMRTLKASLDHNNIMNPGKILPDIK